MRGRREEGRGAAPTRHEELKALHHAGAAAVGLGQGRDLSGMVQNKGGLLQARLHQGLKHLGRSGRGGVGRGGVGWWVWGRPGWAGERVGGVSGRVRHLAQQQASGAKRSRAQGLKRQECSRAHTRAGLSARGRIHGRCSTAKQVRP